MILISKTFIKHIPVESSRNIYINEKTELTRMCEKMSMVYGKWTTLRLSAFKNAVQIYIANFFLDFLKDS